MESRREIVSEALRTLGVANLVLVIHDASYPSEADEDTGRGTPYSQGAARFFELARELGFTGVQFGPQGQTSATNQSPYDGTIFSKNALSIALRPLAYDERWGGVLSRETHDSIVRQKPSGTDRVHHAYAHAAQGSALREAFGRFRAAPPADLARRLAEFRRTNAAWLDGDALYEALAVAHRTDDWRRWPEAERDLFRHDSADAAALAARHADEIDLYSFCQFVVHAQHGELRAASSRRGLKLFGDLQIGVSQHDAWRYARLFMSEYRMGAPPSRTNPEGQRWEYPVLDPALYMKRLGGGSAPLELVRARVAKMLAEFDGLRIDHPHGLVCPWVYRPADADGDRAVQMGARLFESPASAAHPALGRLAIAREAQLDHSRAPYADEWVTDLTPEQLDEYAVFFDVVMDCAARAGRVREDVLCEVLSTSPYPLCRVMERYGLGRFRVTQKANPRDAGDGYRSENAAPPDWIMVGNHDTEPIWLVVQRWLAQGLLEPRARYIAERLMPDPEEREGLVARISADPRVLAQAMLADLFASPARNVMIFFSDLLGLSDVYNTPGVVSPENWTLRVGADYQRVYEARAARGAAMDIPRALATALRARGNDGELVAALLTMPAV